MNRFYLPIEHDGQRVGTFDVTESCDDEYPGVDIEFIPATKEGKASLPRILFEYPKETGSKLRLLVWADPNSEDYTDEIEFDY